MTKQDLTGVLSYRTGIPQDKVSALIDNLTESIKLALSAGESVYLRGFGVFSVKVRKPRKGRIVAKGIEITIPERRVALFKPYPELERVVAGTGKGAEPSLGRKQLQGK